MYRCNIKTPFHELPTSQQLFDFPAGCGSGELIDNVQSRLVVGVAHIHVDARLDTHTQIVKRLCGSRTFKNKPSLKFQSALLKNNTEQVKT